MAKWVLSLENFKSIRHLKELEGRPITLLLGPNNAGKTSVLQALLLLKGSLDYPETVLSFRNDLVDLGSFQSTVTKQHESENIAITLKQSSDPNAWWRFLLRVDVQEGTLQIREYEFQSQRAWQTKNQSDGPQFRPPFAEASSRNGKPDEERELLHFLYARSPFAKSPRVEYSGECDFEEFSLEEQEILENLRWQSFLPTIQVMSPLVIALPPQIPSLYSHEPRHFLQTLQYIGPLRVYPERSYRSQPPPVSDVGIDGRWAPHLLRGATGEQLQDLRRWMGPEGFGLVKDIRARDAKDLPDFVIEVNVRGQWINLRDVGFGMSQLLPIVMESILVPVTRSQEPLLLLEQPEIHLHPKAQADLGTFIVEMAQKGRQYLIETHSEYLVMRLATEVRRGNLSPDDIAIYFLSLDERGYTQFQPIALGEDGRLPPPEKWPEGFFDTNVEEADAFLFASLKHAEV